MAGALSHDFMHGGVTSFRWCAIVAGAAILATMAGAAIRGWGAVLLGQPAIWTVPLSFGVVIVTSLLTQRTLPGNVGQVMLRMHLPEALSRPPRRDRYLR